MWLLSTEELKLVYFNRAEQVEGGYAILSHVWDDREQTFQETQQLQSKGVSYHSASDRVHLHSIPPSFPIPPPLAPIPTSYAFPSAFPSGFTPILPLSTFTPEVSNSLPPRPEPKYHHTIHSGHSSVLWDDTNQGLMDKIPPISPKILGCVKTARAHGFKWLWIDTSCIDKTSSAELSEAINSMFSWYEKASVCYAYLKDVPESSVLDSPDSAFRKSRWFTRGWTLQELIAPRCLVFLSSEWTFLGTKASLATLLSEITGVDVEVLTFRRELQQVSVARRMSWASKRKTTRDEDQAYSLMGIFGITMPTIYGEGFNAFRRLQEEIMKQSTDQTLFAWGKALPPSACRGRLARNIINPAGSLLAQSPRAFAASANYRSFPSCKIADVVKGNIYIPPKDIMTNPDFAITSAGVRCQLLTVDFKPFTLALLACQTATGECIGLLLHQRHDVQTDRLHYLVGAIHGDVSTPPGLVADHPAVAQETEGPSLYRLLYIESSTLAALFEHRPVAGYGTSNQVVGAPRNIYISHDLSFLPSHPWFRLLQSDPQDFYIPMWFLEQSRRLGFDLTLPLWPPIECGKNSRLPTLLRFENAYTGEAFTIYLERVHMWLCVSVSIYPSSHLPLSHYLKYKSDGALERLLHSRAFEEESLGDRTHPSSLAHCVRYWPNGSKTFGDADRTIRISCTRRTTGDQSQYCLDFVLDRSVYVPPVSDSCAGSNLKRKRLGGPGIPVSSRRQRRVNAEEALLEELKECLTDRNRTPAYAPRGPIGNHPNLGVSVDILLGRISRHVFRTYHFGSGAYRHLRSDL